MRIGLRHALGLALTASVLVVSSAGCGRQKNQECSALITVINDGVKRLERSPADAKAKPAGDESGSTDLKSMAEAMDKVAGDAAKLELTIPELKKFNAEYQGMVKEVAKAAREMAAASDSKDVSKITAAQAAIDKAVKQEDPLVEGINKFCQPQ
jgi:hypothetical protein